MPARFLQVERLESCPAGDEPESRNLRSTCRPSSPSIREIIFISQSIDFGYFIIVIFYIFAILEVFLPIQFKVFQ